MASFRVHFLSVLLTSVTLAQASAISGPACARLNYKSTDCLDKCGGNWGFGTHIMGQGKWGQVMFVSPTDFSVSSTISEACGLSSSSDNSSVTSTPLVSGGTPYSVPHISVPTSSQPGTLADYSLHISHSSSSSVPGDHPSTSSSPPTTPTTNPTPAAVPVPSNSSSSSKFSSNSNTFSSSNSNPSSNPNLSSNPNPSSKSNSSSKPNSSSSSTPSSTSSPLPNPKPLSHLSSSNSSSSLNSSSSDSTQTSSSDIDTYLATHNTVRAQHGAVNLTWNTDLATAANTWATGCVFEHSGGTLGPYGENLAAGTGGYTIADGVGDWTSEPYDASNPVASHFTQVVWKATTELGCALVSCAAGTIFDASYGTANYIVCEYSPPGNVIGEFAQNVQD